jgi:hypothetical protein
LGEDLNASSLSAPSSRAAPVRNASAGGVGGVGGGGLQDAIKQMGADMRLMTSTMMQLMTSTMMQQQQQHQAAMMQMFQQSQAGMQQQQMAMLQQLPMVLMQVMQPQIGSSGRAPAGVLPGGMADSQHLQPQSRHLPGAAPRAALARRLHGRPAPRRPTRGQGQLRLVARRARRRVIFRAE